MESSLLQFAGGQRRNGGLVSELLEAVDQLGVADHVEGMGVGGHGSGHVRVPVSAELLRLDREQRALEAARCLDQRLALARHGGQVGRVRAVLRQHRAGLGDHGLRPLPPAAQGVERRGRFGAVRRQRIRPLARVPDLLGRSISHLAWYLSHEATTSCVRAGSASCPESACASATIPS